MKREKWVIYMMLAIIGGKASKKIGEAISESFDDLEILTFNNLALFVQETSLRTLDIHRILLLQVGLEGLTESEVREYSDYISSVYTASRIITVAKDDEYVQNFSDNFNTPFSVHLLTDGQSMKTKVLLDLSTLSVEEIRKKYSSLVYKRVAEAVENVVEYGEDVSKNNIKNINNSGKKNLLGGLFGKKSKDKDRKKSKLQNFETDLPIRENESPSEDFNSEPSNPIDFDVSVFDTSSTDFGLGIDIDFNQFNSETIITEEDSSNLDFKSEEEIEDNFEIDSEPILSEEDSFNLESSKSDNESTDSEFEFDFDFESLNVDKVDDNLGFESTEEEPILEVKTNLELVLDNEPNEIYEERKEIKRPKNDTLDEFKNSLENKAIVKKSKKVENKFTNPTVSNIDEEYIDIDGNLGDIAETFEREKNQVIVEVVKEKIIEKPVSVSSDLKRTRNGTRIIVVTGDRKVGATRLALNLSGYYATKNRTLYVDMDIERHGSLVYLGLEDIVEEPEHIQNGLLNLNSVSGLSNVSYFYRKGGFNVLTSMFGEDISMENLNTVQKIISQQTEFKTIVIDCPLKHINILKDLLYVSNILLCVEENKHGVLNTLLEVTSLVNEETLNIFYNNVRYVLTKSGNISDFRTSLDYFTDIFDLESTSYNWGTVEVIGTLKDTLNFAERL